MADINPANQAVIFRTVKPACVQLGDAALKLLSGAANASNVTSSAENLFGVLRSQLRDGVHIDERLVNYIFFPLSHIYREPKKFPTRAVEIALECLLLLLRSGWRNIKDPKLGLQLLMLLTFLADDEQKPAASRPTTSQELKAASLKCISELFQSLLDCNACKANFASTENLPAVGHAVTVLLDSFKEQAPRDVQVQAAQALHRFCTGIAKPELLRNFLPGIFSTFSHILAPTSKERRPYQVLEHGLSILTFMTAELLADIRSENSDSKNLAWLKATAAQTKLVLANIVKLRDHERSSVRAALLKLCWAVLETCRISLADSISLMLETMIYLLSQASRSEELVRFQQLVSDSSSIRESARAITYDAAVALPRIMASNDEDAKIRQSRQLSTLLKLLHESNTPTELIDGSLQQSLTECLSSLLETKDTYQPSYAQFAIPESSRTAIQGLDDQVDINSSLSINSKAEKSLEILHPLIQALSRQESALQLAKGSLAKVYDNESELTNLWLCFNVLKSRAQNPSDVDLYLEVGSDSNQDIALRNELYALAITQLSQSDNDQNPDWRIQALSLEIVAFEATTQGLDFKVELVDALYPAVHHLGSPVQTVRSLAKRCLDIMAASCGYSDAKDLIVSNVDYLVNAVGMKLNALDISPQMPQVLLMVIKLSGPTVLPYLEDLIEGIFEALECFHGYSLLVEQLFAVLSGAVEEGIKTSAFADRNAEYPSHRKLEPRLQTTQSLASRMSKQRQKENSANQNEIPIDQQSLPLNTPRKPWKELRTKRDSGLSQSDEESSEDDKDPENDDSAVAPPEAKGPTLTKTYKMLQTISIQTQHHLPSSSPAVRISLLSLLTKSLPFLSQHDDTFLPLIHTLWPVLLPRLDDKEAFVVEGVLNVMGRICVGAGDFMTSRIESLWPQIRKIFTRCVEARDLHPRRLGGVQALPLAEKSPKTLGLTSSLVISPAKTEANGTAFSTIGPVRSNEQGNTGQKERYVSTTSRTIRDALTNFLVQLLSHVRVPQEMFHEILHEMLYVECVQEQRQDVQEALSIVNVDAVWFVIQKYAWDQEDSRTSDVEQKVFGYKVPLDVFGGPGFVIV